MSAKAALGRDQQVGEAQVGAEPCSVVHHGAHAPAPETPRSPHRWRPPTRRGAGSRGLGGLRPQSATRQAAKPSRSRRSPGARSPDRRQAVQDRSRGDQPKGSSSRRSSLARVTAGASSRPSRPGLSEVFSQASLPPVSPWARTRPFTAESPKTMTDSEGRARPAGEPPRTDRPSDPPHYWMSTVSSALTKSMSLIVGNRRSSSAPFSSSRSAVNPVSTRSASPDRVATNA